MNTKHEQKHDDLSSAKVNIRKGDFVTLDALLHEEKISQMLYDAAKFDLASKDIEIFIFPPSSSIQIIDEDEEGES